ncbi:MAG: acyltransferase [Akkermansiaceae bacterium]
MYISENVTLNSCTWSNPLNINNSLVLCAFEGAEIILEKGCGISGSRIIASAEIKIGESSLVGAGCLICDSDMHEVPLLSQNAIQIAPIKIGQRVFIGANTTILKGVTIGDGTVIGAGSVVVHDIPENVLAAGNPAKVICSFSQVSKS